MNDYKPGVGGGPDGQILNQCFLRVRFFPPLIVLLFDARSFYVARIWVFPKLFQSQLLAGAVYEGSSSRIHGSPVVLTWEVPPWKWWCRFGLFQCFFFSCCYPCFRVLIQKNKKNKKKEKRKNTKNKKLLEKYQKIYTESLQNSQKLIVED